MMMMVRRRMRTRKASSTLLCTLLLPILLCFQLASAHGGIDDGDGGSPAASTSDPSSSSSAVHQQLRAKGLIAVKVWCLVILLVFTFIGGVSPYLYRWNEAFLLLGTQFAAGVFLGTALMHFLADSTSTFQGLTQKQYPFSYMLACVGFLLTMLADCVIAAVTNKRAVVVNENEAAHAREEEEEEEPAQGAHHQSKEEEEEEEAHAQQQQQHPMGMVVRASSLEDAVLLIFALCFHSVFEGIAIGVSATKHDAWRNLWTIGLHKVFAAVAMGIALLRMIPRQGRPFLTTAAYSLAFAVSSPVGVGIGVAIDATAEGAAADWTYAISMGIATGVFIYVAINHLIAKGYRPQDPTRADTPAFKFLAVLTGIAVMAVVMIWD